MLINEILGMIFPNKVLECQYRSWSSRDSSHIVTSQAISQTQ
jgi:hypothetical protein